MISTLLGAAINTDTRNTIGCLVIMPVFFACLHYYRYKSDCDAGVDTMDAVFSGDRAAEEGTKGFETASAGLDAGAAGKNRNNNGNAVNLGFGHYNETDDNLGFDYYGNRDDGEEDILEQEFVEITFDLGYMEGNVRSFLCRMQRVMM